MRSKITLQALKIKGLFDGDFWGTKEKQESVLRKDMKRQNASQPLKTNHFAKRQNPNHPLPPSPQSNLYGYFLWKRSNSLFPTVNQIHLTGRNIKEKKLILDCSGSAAPLCSDVLQTGMSPALYDGFDLDPSQTFSSPSSLPRPPDWFALLKYG